MAKAIDNQLVQIWAQVENIITILDPKLSSGALPVIKGKVSDEDIKKMLDFLRIAVKYKQFEIESLTRERDSFYNLLMEEKRK